MAPKTKTTKKATSKTGSGITYNTSTGKMNPYNTVTGKSTSPAPAYNSKTGATSGKPSAEYNDYLKSLNKKGSPNYIPTPDDAGYENMDAVNNAAVKAGLPKPVGTPMDTSQPSPTTVQAGAGLPGAPMASSIPSTGNISLNPTQQASYDTAVNKYQQAHGTLKGQEASQDAGIGKGQAGQALQQPAQQPVSPLGGIMEVDANFDSIFTNLDAYMEPLQQKKSLLEEYKGLSNELGIDEINEELINAKRIIEGTEDDIRSEVQAVSGFASDSQILALSNARNKSLVKNYNVLLESRDNAMQQLNTMMDLTIEDRKAAEAEFDRKMNFAFKIAEFKERAVSNSREAFNNVIKNVGYAGLYNALQQDPSSIPLVEKTLGLGAGGLSKLATFKKPLSEEEQLDVDLKRGQLDLQKSNLKTDSLQRKNIQSQIDERDNETNEFDTISGKPQNASQTKANGYADRLSQANVTLDAIGSKFTGKGSFGGSVPTIFQTGDRQAYEQAKKNFVTAVLRQESGASIAPSEFKDAEEIYFPVAGNTPEMVKEKEALRNTVINSFYREAGVNRPVLPNQIIESEGKRYKVGFDGETLTEIK